MKIEKWMCIDDKISLICTDSLVALGTKTHFTFQSMKFERDPSLTSPYFYLVFKNTWFFQICYSKHFLPQIHPYNQYMESLLFDLFKLLTFPWEFSIKSSEYLLLFISLWWLSTSIWCVQKSNAQTRINWILHK